MVSSHEGRFGKIYIIEDTKGVIRISISKNDRPHNGQKKKNKRANNDLQNITHKTKDRVTRTPLKTGRGDELMCSGRVNSSCLIFVFKNVIVNS